MLVNYKIYQFNLLTIYVYIKILFLNNIINQLNNIISLYNQSFSYYYYYYYGLLNPSYLNN